ncbi:MAG TPA: glutaredoxin family protein [Bacteroidota bacterium]|nr:glutaredoxin family protein [Bacteroidota bacterium]
MNVVELYSTKDCGLCAEAKKTLRKLQNEFPFRIEDILLTEEHPKYKEYLVAVPVIVVNHGETVSGAVDERRLRDAMRKSFKVPRLLPFYKFLEALGFLTVAAGLFYGVTRNDEWQELYFFLSGIVVFAVGRILEKRELRRAKT